MKIKIEGAINKEDSTIEIIKTGMMDCLTPAERTRYLHGEAEILCDFLSTTIPAATFSELCKLMNKREEKFRK